LFPSICFDAIDTVAIQPLTIDLAQARGRGR
jgi:hypothetical protein